MLGAVGSKERGMMGGVGAGSKRWFQVWTVLDPDLSLCLSAVAMLQRAFELVPREVLSDGQL